MNRARRAAAAIAFVMARRPGQGPFWTPTRLRAARHGLWLVGIPYAALFLVASFKGISGFDAHAYWAAWSNGLYSAAPEERDAFLYSPAFAQAIWPLSLLAWPVFYGLWIAGTAAAYAWLLAPLGRRWALPLFILSIPEIIVGNIWALLALVVVVGFRYPAAWTFPLLTKITPGLGPLWFVVRREWRSAAISVGVALAIAITSAVLAPHLWVEWARLLVHPSAYANPDREAATSLVHVPVLVRLPIAAWVTIVAARRNRPLLLPFAMVLASPVFAANTFQMLAALPRMRQRRPSTQGETEAGRIATVIA